MCYPQESRDEREANAGVGIGKRGPPYARCAKWNYGTQSCVRQLASWGQP
jgi:hypothetical protein